MRVHEPVHEFAWQLFHHEVHEQRLPQDLLPEAQVQQLVGSGPDEALKGRVLHQPGRPVPPDVVMVERLREPAADLDAEEQQVVARELRELPDEGVEVRVGEFGEQDGVGFHVDLVLRTLLVLGRDGKALPGAERWAVA